MADSSSFIGQIVVTLALAFAGDAVHAQTLADDLGSRFPEHAIIQFNYLPTIRAQLALNRNDSLKPIEVLQTAGPYELSSSGALYPVYVRGEAYLAAHQGRQAAAEFQKILDHRGVVLNAPSAHSPISKSVGPTPCKATPPKPRRPIRISSRYGRTPTPTFPSSSLLKVNTQS